MTSDLIRRVYEHRTHTDPKSFTAEYDVTRLAESSTIQKTQLRRVKRLKQMGPRFEAFFDPSKMTRHWGDLYDGSVMPSNAAHAGKGELQGKKKGL